MIFKIEAMQFFSKVFSKVSVEVSMNAVEIDGTIINQVYTRLNTYIVKRIIIPY